LRNRLTQPSLSQFEILYSAFLRPSRLCHFEAVRCIFSTITRGRHKNALPDRSPTISRLAVLKTAAQIKKRDPDPELDDAEIGASLPFAPQPAWHRRALNGGVGGLRVSA
jgi:hypothetical protein